MSVIDNLTDDLNGRFHLGAKSEPLIRQVLQLITAGAGGIGGFLERLKSAGLSSAVTSWLGSNNGAALTGPEVQRALGSGTMNAIAGKLGLGMGVASTATGYILPKIIGMLTPGGRVPSGVPASVASYLGSAGTEQVSPLSMKIVGEKRSTSWLVPLLILLAGLALLWFVLYRPASQITPAPPAVGVGSPTSPEDKLSEWIKGATAKTTAALSALKPGFGAKELTDILNQSVINFPTGSADVPDESKPWLTTTAEQMKKLPSGTVIEISGHTDNVGDEAANLQLSQERAASVRQFLVIQGVDANALTTAGYGSTMPVASNDSFDGRFKNRRIEFTAKSP